jgi:hypothetical protein
MSLNGGRYFQRGLSLERDVWVDHPGVWRCPLRPTGHPVGGPTKHAPIYSNPSTLDPNMSPDLCLSPPLFRLIPGLELTGGGAVPDSTQEVGLPAPRAVGRRVRPGPIGIAANAPDPRRQRDQRAATDALDGSLATALSEPLPGVLAARGPGLDRRGRADQDCHASDAARPGVSRATRCANRVRVSFQCVHRQPRLAEQLQPRRQHAERGPPLADMSRTRSLPQSPSR